MIRTSLRRRAYAVVVTVVLAPLALVLLADQLGAGEMARMQAAVERGASEAAADLARGDDKALSGAAAERGASEAAADLAREDEALWGAAIERAASRSGVRVTLLDPAGRTLAAADHEAATTLRDRFGDALFGPQGAPALHAFDRERPQAAAWPELEAARRDGRSAACAVVLSGTLLVCHAAILTPTRGQKTVVVLAQKSSPRAIRALFDLRYPLLKLTLYVLLLGALLAAWFGRHIVAPIQRLRREVLDRAAFPLHAPPIPVRSNDEVGDLGHAFNALLGALTAKSRANETFAVDLAHELKSPIAAVRACTDALAGPLDPARAARLARVLRGSTDRLDALVSRFLEIARAEAGLPHDERSSLDAGELLRALCEGLASGERYARVRFDIEVESVDVTVAAGPLEAALANILDNAASFAGDGGWVRARVHADGPAAVFEISDSGPGIAPDKLPRVFDRFFTDRDDGSGTGLGLAYAKAVIEAHGGTLSAASEPGSGASFTVRIPVSHTFHTPAANDSPAA